MDTCDEVIDGDNLGRAGSKQFASNSTITSHAIKRLEVSSFQCVLTELLKITVKLVLIRPTYIIQFNHTRSYNIFVKFALDMRKLLCSLYGIGQTIIFLPCSFFLLLLSFFFFPRLILAVADWMSAILPHMVWP